MSAFEETIGVYREASKDHVGNTPDRERLRSTYLQKAWADKKCAKLVVADESDRERATIEWMEELGEWFRTNILEFPPAPGEASRKDYFLGLFETDPKRAVDELDELFLRLRH